MNTSQRPDSSGPGGFLEALRGRWQIAPVLAALGLLAAAAYVLAVPKVYTATASVKPTVAPAVDNILLPYWVPAPGGAQARNSAGMAASARQMLHSSLSPLVLRNKVTVTVAPGSGVLDIVCTATSAGRAAACANAFAHAYLQNRSATATASLNAQVKTVQGKVNALNKTINTLNARIARLPSNSPTRITDQGNQKVDAVQASQLNNQIAQLNQKLADTSGGSIITAASPPRRPASPDKTLVLASGLAAGLLLGLIIEFWIDRRDKRTWAAVVR